MGNICACTGSVTASAHEPNSTCTWETYLENMGRKPMQCAQVQVIGDIKDNKSSGVCSRIAHESHKPKNRPPVYSMVQCADHHNHAQRVYTPTLVEFQIAMIMFKVIQILIGRKEDQTLSPRVSVPFPYSSMRYKLNTVNTIVDFKVWKTCPNFSLVDWIHTVLAPVVPVTELKSLIFSYLDASCDLLTVTDAEHRILWLYVKNTDNDKRDQWLFVPQCVFPTLHSTFFIGSSLASIKFPVPWETQDYSHPGVIINDKRVKEWETAGFRVTYFLLWYDYQRGRVLKRYKRDIEMASKMLKTQYTSHNNNNNNKREVGRSRG